MALYPPYTTVPYANPRMLTPVTKTLVSQFEDQGTEQRRRKWLYNKWSVGLQYNNITKADASIIFQFFINRDGQYTPFHWIDNFEDTYVKQYFATADGVTTLYDLPGDDLTDYTIYGDASAYSEGVSAGAPDYTISPSGGADGGYQVSFAVAPTIGKRLTTDFTGKLKVWCRFQENSMPFEQFHNLIITTGIVLKGLNFDEG